MHNLEKPIPQQVSLTPEQKERLLGSLSPELFPITNHFIFALLAKKEGFVEEALQVLLDDPTIHVKSVIPEYHITTLARQVVFDAFVQLDNGMYVDLEIQNDWREDQYVRAEYLGEALRTHVAEKGMRFDKIPRVYVLFVCDFLPPNQGNESVDEIIQMHSSTKRMAFQSVKKKFYSTRVEDGTKISKLLKCYTQGGAIFEEEFPVLSRVTQELYREENGKMIDSVLARHIEKVLPEFVAEQRSVGHEDGREEERMTAIKRMIAMGVEKEFIQKLYPDTDLSLFFPQA